MLKFKWICQITKILPGNFKTSIAILAIIRIIRTIKQEQGEEEKKNKILEEDNRQERNIMERMRRERRGNGIWWCRNNYIATAIFMNTILLKPPLLWNKDTAFHIQWLSNRYWLTDAILPPQTCCIYTPHCAQFKITNGILSLSGW